MKQSAVEWLDEQIECISMQVFDGFLTFVEFMEEREKLFKQAKEMEKEQIIEAGNSCAFKQHLHSDRINKMSIDELEQYNLEPSYTFGEEYYNETFKK